MEILQLPMLALLEKIEQELNENPVLELQDFEPDQAEDGPPEDGPVQEESPDSPTVEEKELVVDEHQDNADDFERLVELDREVPDYFDEFPRRSVNRMDEESDRKHDAMANIASRPQSLQDFLLHAAGRDGAGAGDFRDRRTDHLLPRPQRRRVFPHQLWKICCRRTRRTNSCKRLGGPWKIVQSLEPLGVAARDLRECLLVQLRPEMPYYEVQKTLIQDHLEDLRDNRLPAIKRKTGYSHRDHPGGLGRTAEAQSQARLVVRRFRRSLRHARRDHRERRRRPLSGGRG